MSSRGQTQVTIKMRGKFELSRVFFSNLENLGPSIYIPVSLFVESNLGS